MRDPDDPLATTLDDVVRTLRPRLIAFIRRIVVDPWIAEDVAQDAMVKLCRRWRSRMPTAIAPWLFAVARNLALDHLQGRRREAHVESRLLAPRVPDDPLTPFQVAAEAETHAILRAAIERLPERRRRTLQLCALEELDQGTVAAMLDCPKSTINSRMARSRETLRLAMLRHAS